MNNVKFDLNYNKTYSIIAGCDEAGRGPLAGPVVVASVVMPLEKSKLIKGINDSKKLTAKKRAELYEKIKEVALDYKISQIDNETIDRINILQATKLGMENVINGLNIKPDIVLIDAVKNLKVEVKQEPLIKGDEKSYNIGAASILAKVFRDNLMCEMDKIYPQYDFKQHKGYGTREHIMLLKKYGKCKIHRNTFIKHFVGEKKDEQ